MRATLRVLGAAAALTLALAGQASAADNSSLNVVKVDGRNVELLMTFVPKEVVTAQTPVSATLEVEGRQLAAPARVVIDDQLPTTAILVMDTSGSMKGDQMAAAQDAANKFLDGLPDTVQTGLVTFNDGIEVLAQPTTDRGAVKDQIAAIKSGGHTALYDGVLAALDLVPAGTKARLLVLSDGGDSVSKASLAQATDAIQASGLPVDVVAIDPTAKEEQALRDLSTPNAGNLRTAKTASDLAPAFTAASTKYAARAFITGKVPVGVEAQGKPVSAQVRVADQAFDASATLPDDPSLSATAADPDANAVSLPVNKPLPPVEEAGTFVPLVLGLLAIAIVLLIVFLVRTVKGERKSRSRLNQVLNYQVSVGGQTTVGEPPGIMASMVLWLDGVLARRSSYRTTITKIGAADFSFLPATWLLVRLGIIVVLFVVLSVLLQSLLLGLLLAVVAGWVLSNMWLRSRAERRRKAFSNELPDFLLLLASGLRAGLSFTSALDSAAAEGPGEVGRQMRRALGEVQLGAQLDEALTACAERMDSEDLRWTVTALSIQREVGGNLSTILEAAAESIKGRYALRREVATLSAEGKLSAYVLVALPLGIFAFLALFRRDYIATLWSTPMGLVMLFAICVLILVGWVWMRSIVRIKV